MEKTEYSDEQGAKLSVEALTEKETTVTIDILHPSFFDKLFKRSKKTFVFKPACYGTLMKIAGEGLSLDFDVEQDLWQQLQKSAAKTNKIPLMIAYGLLNNGKEPPKKLLAFLTNNLTVGEGDKLLALIFEKCNWLGFMRTILSIKGSNIIPKRSPLEQGS